MEKLTIWQSASYALPTIFTVENFFLHCQLNLQPHDFCKTYVILAPNCYTDMTANV